MVILIVDDDPVSLLLSAHILRTGGYEVVTADSAEDAIDTLNADEAGFDAILCDYMMPGRNGLELLDELSATDAPPCPPFVLLTGMSEASDLNDDRVELVSAYLTKPVKSDDLLAVVAQVVANVD